MKQGKSEVVAQDPLWRLRLHHPWSPKGIYHTATLEFRKALLALHSTFENSCTSIPGTEHYFPINDWVVGEVVVKGLWYNLDVWLWVIKWEHLCACVCVCVCMRACACECIFVCVCTKCKFYQGLLTIAVLHMGTRHYDNTDSNVALK